MIHFFKIIIDLNFGNLYEKVNNIDETVWFGILMARKKYIKNSPDIYIPQTLPLQKYIIRDFSSFIKKLERTDFTKFTDKNGNYIPIESLALYISLNPRDVRRAAKNLSKELIDVSFDNDINRMRRLDQIVYQCYHKAPLKCGRCVIDIDINYDRGDREIIELNVTDAVIRYCTAQFKSNGLKMIVKTRGGIHVYIDLTKMGHNGNKYLFNQFRRDLFNHFTNASYSEFIKEIEINTDPLIVVPGTLQGGHEVKTIWVDGSYVEE